MWFATLIALACAIRAWRRVRKIEARNEADNTVYRSEKLLKENGDKLSGDNKGKIEKAIAEVKEALKGTDTAALKSASERLNEAWQGISAELYKAAQQQAGPQPGAAGPEPQGPSGGESKDKDKDVIDAEVVDDKK